MRDAFEDTRKSMTMGQKCTEVNPLVQFLGLAGEGFRKLSLNSQLKRVIFSADGGMLLQALAKASRVRVYASIAFLECAAVDMPVDEIIAFLQNATDNEILEKVLEKVEGPGTQVAPGLKAAMKKSKPLKAWAIGLLNRLIGQGCNINAALNAAADRHYKMRGMLGFARINEIHPLAQLAVHLCSTEREILTLDSLIRRLEQRAPAALPQESAILKLENFSQLSELLKNRILRYRGILPVPEFSHPRLEWIQSIPHLRSVGKAFQNCLNVSITYPVSLVLGRSLIAIYTHESKWGSVSSSTQYVLHVTHGWEDGASVLTILDAKESANREMSGSHLVEALRDLNKNTDAIWRLSEKMIIDEMLLHDWQNDF